MIVCKQIREFYGISQQELANYLNISQSLLAQVEGGTRSISTAALLKLNHLEIHRVDKSAAKRIVSHSLPAVQQQAFNKQLAREIKKLDYRVQTLTMRLEAMKAVYARAVQKRSLVNMPVAKSFKGDDAGWLKSAQAGADKAIKENHEGMQAILQSKIDGLLLQVKGLKNII